MIKKLWLFSLLIGIIGCVSIISTKQLNSVRPGISKTNFIERYGEPEITEYIDGYYLLTYMVRMHPDPYVFIFKNNKLISWQKDTRKDKSKITGLILQVPLK